jgi:PAS domain S-box-containing protein
MNIFQFYLTEMGFVSLILIFLSLLITVYLIQARSKSRSSWLLISFFCAVILNGLTMLIANAWVFWGGMLMPAQDAWVLLGGVALAQYAYHYPQLDQKHEARFILVITGSVAIFSVGYSLYYALQYIFKYSADLEVNRAYYLLLPIMTLFIVAVFLRRSVYYASLQVTEKNHPVAHIKRLAKVVYRPPNRVVCTLRDFSLALSLGLLPGIAYFLKPIPFIPAWIPSYMLSIGSVLAVSALALVYINRSGERTSLIGKIIGISLVTFLLIFGAFGSSLIERSKANLPGGEIGLSQIHDLVVYLAFWTILSCLIILFFFPVFYRINLVYPLNHLLDGVKRADRGDLEIQIPVQYEDEIGSLTHSFNNLVASLQESNQARDAVERELKQRLEELHLSEEKFYKAFHSSPVAMVLQNRDDRKYLDVNAAFSRITGYDREEAVGHTPGEVNIYPTDKDAKQVADAFLETQGLLRNFEFRFKRKDGQVGTGLLSSEIFELQGIKTLLGIVLDITERKRAEEKIQLLNIEMERRVAERSWQLSTLLDLAFLVSHPENPENIFLPALERLVEIGGLDAVCIHIYSDDRRYLRLEAQIGLETDEADLMQLTLPSGFFAAWLSRPKDALIFSGLEPDAFLSESLRPDRLHSCVFTQLVARGEVLGILSCYRQEVHTFTLEEVSLLVAVAEQLGISLENQRLRQAAEQAAITTERRRLARDLHDSITQSLYGLTLFTRSSQDALREGDQEKLVVSLEQIEANALIALKEMRLLLFQMQPQGLEAGFLNGINARFDLVERRLGVQATCQVDEQIPLSTETEAALYRIALEALNNSLKHAQASHVHVSLEQVNGTIVMEILDDGMGFDIASEPVVSRSAGMGILNMHDRAAELNGNLEVYSSPGQGTRVRLVFDLSSEQAVRRTG